MQHKVDYNVHFLRLNVFCLTRATDQSYGAGVIPRFALDVIPRVSNVMCLMENMFSFCIDRPAFRMTSRQMHFNSIPKKMFRMNKNRTYKLFLKNVPDRCAP